MSVKTAFGQRLSFKFLDMDIANIFGCDDYLEIRDGSSTSSSRECLETVNHYKMWHGICWTDRHVSILHNVNHYIYDVAWV